MAFEPSAYFGLPRAELFTIPPNAESGFLLPPPVGSIPYAPPVDIPDHVYRAWLDPKVPITIAAVYAVTAKALNVYNKSTGKKPWAISKTRVFKAFVILHNVFLAVYSAWTWWGMLGALRRSLVSPLGPHGVAGFLDSACRMNGPSGFGNGVFYDENSKVWQSYSNGVVADGPSRFDQGRLWNEGLAFYGWLFYLSKFYEVFDTLIILAKGKLSSTLQTYHHAGAMMCMWAGIRYMSPPIWIFVFFNSFIHAIMYTYYTVTAFRIRVPMFIKRSLTSMQITQFLVGASLAMVHSFVYYTFPTVDGTAGAAPAEASAAAGVNGSTSEAAGVIGSVKYTRETSPCITNSGNTFGIWLNVLYLAPLTYLFVSFFIESYLRRSNAEQSKKASRRLSNNVVLAEKAGWDAAKSMEREVYGESSEAIIDEPATKAKNGRVLRNRN